MSYGAYPSYQVGALRPRGSRSGLSSALACLGGLVAAAAAGLWVLQASTPAPRSTVPMPRLGHAAAPVASRPLDPSFTAPTFTAGLVPAAFADHVAGPAGFHVPAQDVAEASPPRAVEPLDPEAEAIIPLPPPPPPPAPVARLLPLPTPRPALLAAVEAMPKPAPTDGGPPLAGRRRLARLMPAAPNNPAPDPRGVFDKLFGDSRPPRAAMAYATPEDGGLGGFGATRGVASDGRTAVYDIAAHTVTLPDGTRLEAHSGLGSNLDNPRSVAMHMRGATPPAVYDLMPREGLFHGVAALRLNPVGGAPYGRLGLLAHTYMLGPRGDSNGCVVFRDYRAFRQAYDAGRVRRLVVIAGRG